MYKGYPVHGYTATSTGSPTDSYGRNVYLDTRNSRYGDGWRRENGFLTHKYGGNFCYLFFARKSYYDSTTRPPGQGDLYRATVMGPGVTPIVRAYAIGRPNWTGSADQIAHEDAMNALGDIFAAQEADPARGCNQH